MVNGTQPSKKRKIKSSAYVPTSHLRSPGKRGPGESRTLQSTKLKKTELGGFKVVNTRGVSGVNVPNISINDPRTTEEILESFYSASEDYRWDEAYVNGFIDQEIEPPTQDPEAAAGFSATPKKGVRHIPSFPY